jgi:hypothetical protein
MHAACVVDEIAQNLTTPKLLAAQRNSKQR